LILPSFLDISLPPPVVEEMSRKRREKSNCVDFRNLNRSSLKDNYPLPKNRTNIAKGGWCTKNFYG